MIGTAAALALLAGAASTAAGGPRITLEAGVVRAEPVSAAASLELFVDGAAGLPPVLGVVERQGVALLFRPRFPLQPGRRYRAVYRETDGAAPLTVWLDVTPAPARPPTRLERIDPTPDVFPENLLKLYLNFSAPMSRGEAYRRIRLLDEAGAIVELPFLEIAQELWDRDARRLTLLFDPGRVKRDLLPHEEVGSPLRAGGAYTLVVDAGWPDAQGSPLGAEVRKSFRVGAPDHDPPQTRSWRLAAPHAGTAEPLVVTFPEPLDRALLERVLEVSDPSGAPVPGDIVVEPGETRWRFTPRAAWRAGDHTLRAATILEDLAGNSLGRPFEVDVFERVRDRALEATESVRFRIE
jgi:hypothetical protein